jgi:hypothetical protein
MISSASSPERAPRAGPLDNVTAPGARLTGPEPDRISTAHIAFLRAELARQPEVRPAVVARAQALAADPNYPSLDIMRRVARQIAAAPDLTADDS